MLPAAHRKLCVLRSFPERRMFLAQLLISLSAASQTTSGLQWIAYGHVCQHSRQSRQRGLQSCSPSCSVPLAASSKRAAGRPGHPSQPAASMAGPRPAGGMQVKPHELLTQRIISHSSARKRPLLCVCWVKDAYLFGARRWRCICCDHCPDLHARSPRSSLLAAHHLWACTGRVDGARSLRCDCSVQYSGLAVRTSHLQVACLLCPLQ